jgi:hypothetical protein
MELIPLEELIKIVVRSYERNPRARWQITIGKSGRYWDLLFRSSRRAWRAKIDSIYKPMPKGVGIEIEVRDLRRIKSPPYGMRPLSDALVRRILDSIHHSSSLEPIIQEVMLLEPLPRRKITTPGVLSGPLIYSPRSLALLSKKQRKLDLKLERELKKLACWQPYV